MLARLTLRAGGAGARRNSQTIKGFWRWRAISGRGGPCHSTRFGPLSVYSTRKSGRGPRRVIAKAEYTGSKAIPRFIVTSLSMQEFEGRALYEDFYCARSEMENRTNEAQLDPASA